MNLVVGAPVTARRWVLDAYLNSLRAQVDDFDQASLVFLYGEAEDRGDDGTLERLHEEERGPWREVVIVQDDGGGHLANRSWSMGRYEMMAGLRNRLLRVVRAMEPDYYLSCDTDMLLQPKSVLRLRDAMTEGGFDGVAPLAYMTPWGVKAPNAMSLDGSKRARIQGFEGVLHVPACFGVVLMSPLLYHVDYRADSRGEDIGWARNVAAAGLRLGLCTTVKAKHVMRPERLDAVDERVGF